ncbi:hypothetical protein E3J39_01210 [Candidatus Bathyarchaeota archaeon]|nr:MAG: hypothetical protein E3J39_01210 [Candidatus Bathyarchaeota archaeon]
MFDNIVEVIICLVTGLWSGILVSWLYWRVRINDLEVIIGGLQSSKDEKDVSLTELKTLLQEQEIIIKVLNDQMQEKEETILNLTSLRMTQVKSNNDLKREITTLQSLNHKLGARIEIAETRVEELDASLLEKESEVATFKARMELMQDNLSIIPGVGPKVSYLLRSARIDTFGKLATTSVKKIREVLEAENPNLLRLIDPSNWPDQARTLQQEI